MSEPIYMFICECEEPQLGREGRERGRQRIGKTSDALLQLLFLLTLVLLVVIGREREREG